MWNQTIIESLSSIATPVPTEGNCLRLRISRKLFLSTPMQAVTLFLAVQVAFGSPTNLGKKNFSNIENSTLPFDDKFSTVQEKEFLDNVSLVESNETLVATNTTRFCVKFIEIPTGNMKHLKDMIYKLITNVAQDNRNERNVIRSKRNTFLRFHSRSRTTKLETELNKIKAGIESINTLKERSAISSTDRIRLSTLESSLEYLQKQLDDEMKLLRGEIFVVSADIEDVVSTLNQVLKDIKDIKRRVEEIDIAEKEKQLQDECVRDIQAHRFSAAKDKLQLINDKSEINRIVKLVYNNQEGNFDLLLKFAVHIRDHEDWYMEQSLSVFNALRYEMRTNGHNNPFKMLKFVNIIKWRITEVMLGRSAGFQKEAIELKNDLENSIRRVATEILKNGMINDDFNSKTEIKELSDSIDDYSNDLFNYTIKDVVNDVYDRNDTGKILEYIRSCSYTTQRITGLLAAFDQMKMKDDVYKNEIFNLAYYIKDTMEMSDYPRVKSYIRSELENLKERLPSGVRAIVFSSRLCIVYQNSDQSEFYEKYLYASDTYGDITFFTQRRRHIRLGSNDKSTAYWTIERGIGNTFWIKNNYYNEYLYSAKGSDRSGYTWALGGKTDIIDQGEWLLELIKSTEDLFDIKSVFYSNYPLLASRSWTVGHKSSSQIHILSLGGTLENGYYKWQIKNCS